MHLKIQSYNSGNYAVSQWKKEMWKTFLNKEPHKFGVAVAQTVAKLNQSN